jgi:hypothetical protein
MSRYNARGITSVALGKMDLKVRPPEPWYAERDDQMPLLRISTAKDTQDEYYCLTKSAVDALLKALGELRELPTQYPKTLIQM